MNLSYFILQFHLESTKTYANKISMPIGILFKDFGSKIQNYVL